jgi:predicted ATP-grasp superfamily ATP-dependent carboligase
MNEQSNMYELEFPAPELSSASGEGPILVHGLEGFSDAGHAVALATRHLRDALETELVASFAVDELIDYRSRRPHMIFHEDHWCDYRAPELNLYAVRDNSGQPFLLLAGLEPDLKWDRFTTAVQRISEQLGVRAVVGLNAIPMSSPHTRPLGVSAHSKNMDFTGDYHSWNGEMSIPGSASALIEFRMGQAGYASAGFTVHVPHYLSQNDYPAAALVLLEAVGDVTGLDLPLAALTDASARTREAVNRQMEEHHEIAALVRNLETQYDAYMASREHESLLAVGEDLPSGDELRAELERVRAAQGGTGQNGSGAVEN